MTAEAVSAVVVRGRAHRFTIEDRCGLCATALADPHRHAFDVERGAVFCLCRACSLGFGGRHARSGRYRLVPERRVCLSELDLGALGLPTGLTTIVLDDSGTVRASGLGIDRWAEWEIDRSRWAAACVVEPQLASIEPYVEALLIQGARLALWIVPVDDAYRLGSVVKARASEGSGGEQPWTEIEAFFDELAWGAGSLDGW